jgi:pilus assembly protein Flp/PilA
MVKLSMASLQIRHLKLAKPRKGSLSMQTLLSRFVRDESGVTAIEYGLIAALISVVCIGAMTVAGTQLNAVYTQIGNSLTGALGGGGGGGG